MKNSLRELEFFYKGLENERKYLKNMNETYKLSIGDVIQSGKFAIDSMNHEKTEKSFFKRIFSRKSKKKAKKGNFNTMGKIVKLNENMAGFQRSDPAVSAGLMLKKDVAQKKVIDNILGIEGFVKPKNSTRPTTHINNIEDEKSQEEEQKVEVQPEQNQENQENVEGIEIDQEDIVQSQNESKEVQEQHQVSQEMAKSIEISKEDVVKSQNKSYEENSKQSQDDAKSIEISHEDVVKSQNESNEGKEQNQESQEKAKSIEISQDEIVQSQNESNESNKEQEQEIGHISENQTAPMIEVAKNDTEVHDSEGESK